MNSHICPLGNQRKSWLLWKKEKKEICFLSLFCVSGELRSSAWLVILHKGNQSSFQRSSSEPYIVEAIWNRLVALSSSQSPSNAQGRVLRVYVNQCGTESETKSLTRTNCVGNGTQCGQPQSQDAFPCHLFKGSSLLLCAFEEENTLLWRSTSNNFWI